MDWTKVATVQGIRNGQILDILKAQQDSRVG